MVKRNFNNDCAPAQYRINTKKPTRSRSNGVFIRRTKELRIFGISIFKSTTLLIGQGIRKVKPRIHRNEITLLDLLIAALLAFVFATGIEIAKIFFTGVSP